MACKKVLESAPLELPASPPRPPQFLPGSQRTLKTARWCWSSQSTQFRKGSDKFCTTELVARSCQHGIFVKHCCFYPSKWCALGNLI